MRALKITCMIRCDSAETLRNAMGVAENEIRPDHEIVRTFWTRMHGIEQNEIRTFRLGDYFDRIRLDKEKFDDSLSFRLIFSISQNVRDTYWKDLLMAVLRSIRGSAPGIDVSIEPVTKPV